MENNTYNLVILGAGGVGKSALSVQFIENHFFNEYDPTFDSYRKQVTIDDETCLLNILDPACQEENSAMQNQYMRIAHGFLIIYSVTSKSSFDEEIHTLREKILRLKDTAYFPIMLVGNKCDLDEERHVTESEGKKLANEWKCNFYETSARKRINVEECFYDLVREIRRVNTYCPPNNKRIQSIQKECLLM